MQLEIVEQRERAAWGRVGPVMLVVWKGRIAVPARFRPELTGAFVSKWIDGCLAIHPRAAWDVLSAKVGALPVTDGTRAQLSRYTVSRLSARPVRRPSITGELAVSAGSAGRRKRMAACSRATPFTRITSLPATLNNTSTFGSSDSHSRATAWMRAASVRSA